MCSTSNCMRRANVLHVAENVFKDPAPENGSEGCFVETTLHLGHAVHRRSHSPTSTWTHADPELAYCVEYIQCLSCLAEDVLENVICNHMLAHNGSSGFLQVYEWVLLVEQ